MMCILLISVIFLIPVSGVENICSPCSCNFTVLNCRRYSNVPILTEIPRNIDKSIEVMDFSGQFFTQLKENNFAHFNDLRIINFFKNKISVLQRNLFLNLTNLKEIRLMSNIIHTIEDGCFSNLPSLEIVDLSYNKLITLQISIATESNMLKYFVLHGNPWNCNKNLCPVMNSIAHWDYIHFNPRCEEPVPKYYKKWNELLTYFTPSLTLTKTNQTISLQCEYCFASKIIWKFNGSLVTDNHRIVLSERSVTSTLILTNIEHQGMYSCEIANCTSCNKATITNMNIVFETNKESSDKENVIVKKIIDYASTTIETTINDEENNNATESQPRYVRTIEITGYQEGSIFLNSYVIFTIIVSVVILITLLFMLVFWYNGLRNIKLRYNQEESNFEEFHIRFGPDPIPFPPPESEPRMNQRTRRSQSDQETSERNRTENSSETENLIRETSVNDRR